MDNVTLFPSLKRVGEDQTSLTLDKEITGSLFHTVEYEISGIVSKIDHLDDTGLDEINHIIINQHNLILNYDLFLMNSETRSLALKIFTNKRFLQCFLNVCGALQLSDHEKICLNKIAYDYYTYSEKDIEISDLLFQLTTWVNNREVLILSGFLGMNGAKILAMIKNSSFKTEKRIHRVNTFLIKCGIDLSVQDIINILCSLFPRFSSVFTYSMLEAKPAGLTLDQSNRFDAISIALLDILDSMTTEDIYRVLSDYGYMTSMVKPNTPVRFAIKTAVNYPRIISELRRVEYNQNIIIQ